VLSANKIKFIKSLQLKKNRIESGLFVIEGEKIVSEAISFVPEFIECIYHTSEYNIKLERLTSELITEKELSRISGLKSPNKCLALVQIGFHPNVSSDSKGTLVLDSINDPGNLGTIIRTADWFGIREIICSEDTADILNPKVIQSTMGSLFHMKITYQNLIEFFSGTSGNIYGAVLNGENMEDVSFDDDPIIIIGNESKGISSEIKSILTHPVTIQKYGLAESLNAGIATGILLCHWKKRIS
jgi:TrmH family RNA methyltransferase